jgi:hypothetical protein
MYGFDDNVIALATQASPRERDHADRRYHDLASRLHGVFDLSGIDRVTAKAGSFRRFGAQRPSRR